MKMKTERGRRKVGRRLGLPEADPKRAFSRVSLTRPVGRDELARQPEASEAEEEAQPREEGAPTDGTGSSVPG